MRDVPGLSSLLSHVDSVGEFSSTLTILARKIILFARLDFFPMKYTKEDFQIPFSSAYNFLEASIRGSDNTLSLGSTESPGEREIIPEYPVHTRVYIYIIVLVINDIITIIMITMIINMIL